MQQPAWLEVCCHRKWARHEARSAAAPDLCARQRHAQPSLARIAKHAASQGSPGEPHIRHLGALNVLCEQNVLQQQAGQELKLCRLSLGSVQLRLALSSSTDCKVMVARL